MEINNKKVGRRIENIRLQNGLTMEEFGKKFDTSKGTINNWEKGRNLPNKKNLKIVAKIGNISVSELLYSNSNIKLEELLEEFKTVTYKNLNKEEIIAILDEHMDK